ncbi:hypothetical protein [Agrobacterium pusense]|uniref:hypothetical protein n=1 Tax=Agrobacterium pusense TaxID=648995 RepID=UPI001C6EA4A2|nr:hypothetical protein [Agrobacterium pusense]MBW9060332.1 hypothetical protein [Agrobacterium pusense]
MERVAFTFENLEKAIEKCEDVATMRVPHSGYRAPVGLRLLMKPAKRISAIIFQNGNAYECFSDGWGRWQISWRKPTQPIGTRAARPCRQTIRDPRVGLARSRVALS